MSDRFRRAILALTLVAMSAPGVAFAEDALPDHVDHTTHIVGIARNALFPTIKQITPSDAFGWLNYSASNATISFEQDIVAQMTCRGPSPFQLTGDRLMAPRIPSGGYATLCSLAPGEYDYRVDLVGSNKTLLGKIVVVAEGQAAN